MLNCRKEIEVNSRLIVGEPNYTDFRIRLNTFKDEKWDKPEEFAYAGFFHDENSIGDEVTCAFCQIKLCDWLEGDNPLVQHFKHGSHCSFLEELISKILNENRSIVPYECKLLLPFDKSVIVQCGQNKDKNFVQFVLDCENMQLMKDKENCSPPKLECSICYFREVNVVILPCKHVVACEECANRIGKCCVCKADITATMKICVS